MIIVKINNGLGNQMFQYAHGIALAREYNTELYLDCSWFDTQNKPPYRKVGLFVFNISEKIISPDKISQIKNLKRIVDKESQLFQNIGKIKGDIILDGYWQSEKYFAGSRDIILEKFTIKNPRKIDYENTIKDSNAVSIHVRRTDFLKVRKAQNICTLDYYKKGIEYIENKVKDPTYFIFSDDLQWVKANLTTNYPTYFMEGNKDYEDIHLMSLCQHHIIANSSFSWWGAWLNRKTDKIVVYPKEIRKGKPKTDVSDYIPENWKRKYK